MTSEFFGPLPPSDFNRDDMVRWLNQQVVSFQKIITGSLQADNILSSSNYVAGTSGWMIDGDGDAEFNSIVIRDDFFSVNWDGTEPANLASPDTGATVGFYLDSSAGAAQFMGDVYVGGDFLVLSGGTIRTEFEFAVGQTQAAELTSGGLFFESGQPDETDPGFLIAESGGSFGADTAVVLLNTPVINTTHFGGYLTLKNDPADAKKRAIMGTGSASGGLISVGLEDAAVLFDSVMGLKVESRGTLVPDGTEAAPSFSFIAEPGTGIYRVGANILGITANGTGMVTISTTAITLSNTLRIDPAGWVYSNDTDLGIYRAGTNNSRFVAGGNDIAGWNSSGFYVNSGTTGSAANVHLAGATLQLLVRSTSALKYKSHLSDADLADIELRPMKFYREDDDAWYYGFIADWLGEQDRLLGTYDENGEIENYDQRAVMAVMAAKINRLEQLVLADV